MINYGSALMAFALSRAGSFFLLQSDERSKPFAPVYVCCAFFCITSKTQPSKCSSSSTVRAALGLLLLSLHRPVPLVPPETHLSTGMLLLTDDDDDDALPPIYLCVSFWGFFSFTSPNVLLFSLAFAFFVFRCWPATNPKSYGGGGDDAQQK